MEGMAHSKRQKDRERANLKQAVVEQRAMHPATVPT
jgi:hypothetical protein